MLYFFIHVQTGQEKGRADYREADKSNVKKDAVLQTWKGLFYDREKETRRKGKE